MATKTFTALTAVTTLAAGDELVMWNAAAGAARKITVANFFTSPTLVTPILGVATATSLNVTGVTNINSTGLYTVAGLKLLGAIESMQTAAGAAGDWIFGNGGVLGLGDDYIIYSGDVANSGVRFVIKRVLGYVGLNGVTTPVSALDIGAGAMTLAEMTAPSAPAGNGGIFYLDDNGSGKTRLMVRFATGAAQQLAIEP